MMMKRIKEIEFGVLSPDHIRKMSALEIKNPETYDKDGYPMELGLMDPHLGVINPGLRCKTCGQKMKECPGHFGNLELVRPVVHSEFGKKVEELMHSTCQACGRISLPEEQLQKLKEKMPSTFNETFTKSVVRKAKKIKKCPYCNTIKGSVLLDKPTNFFLNKERIYPTQIREWIEKIPNDDLTFFGYNPEKIRPEWFVLTTMQVPPITIRPSITLETGIKSEDDLTHKLVDIIRINLRLKDNIDAGAPQLIIEDLWDLLQYHVTTYFDNNTAGVPPAKHRSGRALRTLVQRLKGKKGRFRYNLTGKRVNFAARSTITPDPYISISQVGIPQVIAKDLTVPVTVTEANKKDLQELITKTDKVKYVIRPNGSRRKVVDEFKKELVEELSVGFKVERELADDDIVLFNRQPSLHRLSMMAHKAKIMNGKTMRLNPTVCVSPETKVLFSNNVQCQIKDIEENWNKINLLTYNVETDNSFETNLQNYFSVSPQEINSKCFEIVTEETSRKIKATSDHPFYTNNGIVKVSDLKIGDKVVVNPINTPLFNPINKVFLDIKSIENIAPKKTYLKHSINILQEKKLLPLNLGDIRIMILARLVGHLIGDGTLILKDDIARTIFRGNEEDLKEIQRDIGLLGFEPEKIYLRESNQTIVNSKGEVKPIKGRGYSFEVRSKPFVMLLNALGVPSGDKVIQSFRVPQWILDAPLYIKREFIASYFGCELTTPHITERTPISFRTPIFKIAKVNSENAKQFIEDIKYLLKEFEVDLASVTEEDGNIRKNGEKSRIFVVRISSTNTSQLNLYGRIGYAYCKQKDSIARLVFQYLQIKEIELSKRRELFELVHNLRSQGVNFKEISNRTGISIGMIEKWMYSNKETAGIPKSFPTFNEWKKENICSEKNGLVFETISEIKEITIPKVFDVTTQSSTHNFFANSFLTGNCKPYNADFDGDEMNLHVPQTEEGKSEARELMFVENNIISARHGGPVIILDEDGVTGVYILTMKQTVFSRAEAMKLVYELGFTELPSNNKQITGKEIFSMLLPKDLNLEYRSKTARFLVNSGICKDFDECKKLDAIVKIKNGELLEGVIDSASLGEGSGLIVDTLAKNYPREIVRNFYDKLSRLSSYLVTLKGVTVGLDEYTPSDSVNKLKKKVLEEESQEAEKLINQFKKGTLEHIPGRSLSESFEIKMMQLAFRTKNQVEKQLLKEKVQEVLSENPPFNTTVMILSGARGNPTNLTNISGFWGQAAVREGRPKRGFNQRLITVNQKGDVGLLAGGFIVTNFMEGMNGREYFYHSMGGRQGEVDTGVSTKVSGYLYRRLANSLKDLSVAHDGTVRGASKNIIQFNYGDDGVFPTFTVRGKNIDVKKEVEEIIAKNKK